MDDVLQDRLREATYQQQVEVCYQIVHAQTLSFLLCLLAFDTFILKEK